MHEHAVPVNHAPSFTPDGPVMGGRYPDNPTPRGYGYNFWDPDRGAWVMLDDCQHRTGNPFEFKSEYDGPLSFFPGEDNVTKDWLDQSERQLNATKGRALTWVFALESDRDHAAEIFSEAGKGREEINLLQIPRLKASR